MIWQNAWAWLGLVALVLPVLIHLLARRSARVQRFPTLRFLDATRLVQARRMRLRDPLLLAVRLAILAVAVAALAQPLLLTVNRKRDVGSRTARAIIVDTSASMLRSTPAGERALDAAQREAQRLAGEAQTSVIVGSMSPARALPGALAWLSTQPGRREVVVISDFQQGTLEPPDLTVIPPEAGVQFIRIDVGTDSGPIERKTRQVNMDVVASITLVQNRTNVEWTLRAAPPDSPGQLLLLAGPLERTRAEAARQAALNVGAPPPLDSSRAVAIVYPQYERRADLLRAARPLDQPWMGDVVARTAGGHAAALAARGTVEGRERLLLFSLADAGSLASAALIAAVSHAISTAPPVTELEPATLPLTTLQQWQRPAADVAPTRADAGAGASDGRWLWALALLLLAIETWLRRRPRAPRDAELDHGHVA